MKAVTSAQMRALDDAAIQHTGIPGVVLMENAGLRVVELVEKKFPTVEGLDVVVLCGKGNNGGDGFVIARHLANAGARVRVFTTADSDEVEGEAAVHRAIAEDAVLSVTDIRATTGMESFTQSLERCGLVVDAMLGTGISGEVRGVVRQVIEELSGCRAPTVAVDIPSGIDSDTGNVCGAAVSARWTVTFALPKVGLLIYPGAAYCGEVWLGDIGIPAALVHDPAIGCHLITPEMVRTWLPKRGPEAHKGSCGRVAIVAGSSGYAGAAILASRAATRSGVGLVTLCLPRSVNSAVKAASVESTTLPLPETAEQTVALEGLADVLSLLKRVDALALGPGISRNGETLEFVRELVSKAELPVVLDADAVFAFAGKPELLKTVTAPKIMTPHPGEMSYLLGIPVEAVQSNRLGIARQAAERSGSTIVLKGARTVIATPEGETYINPTGNAGMATGGTGDVLTGLIVALLGQGLSPTQAAAAGAYLHGTAGDSVAAERGEAGLIAGDLVDALPGAWMEVMSGDRGQNINARLRRLT